MELAHAENCHIFILMCSLGLVVNELVMEKVASKV